MTDVPGLAFIVQSPTASAVEVAQAVQLFLEGSLGEDGITEAQFDRHKQALISEILRPHKNLWEQSSYFWREIARRELDFASRQQLVDAVEAVDYAQWREWLREVAINRRAAVAVTAAGRWQQYPEGKTVDSVPDFKQGQPAYSIP